jgi:hypothetical protein
MKTTLFFLLLIPFFSHAQLNDGKYFYKNEKGVSCDLTVTNGGFNISVILNMGTVEPNVKYIGKGELRNTHGTKWYEFQSPECNFSFDIPTETMTLEKFDCKNGAESVSYTLKKSELSTSTWLGTYKNASGGILTISQGTNSSTFKFKLLYNGTTVCDGLEWVGSAKLQSETIAKDNTDCPIVIELKGNKKLVFSIEQSCDAMVGLNCLYSFDSDFTKQ